jgi:tetratricopeptide (TPR) repeat protein
VANANGLASLKNDDPASAEDYFQKAHDLDPSDQNVADNLALAKRLLDQKNAAAKAVQNMRSIIVDQTHSFSAGDDSTAGAASALPFVDPNAVDARHIASGLPQSVDTAIAADYANAPSGVSDRVRAGYEAVAQHDWKVARAWFQDALNHDPGDAGLQRLVDLADHTEDYMEKHHLGKVTDSPASGTPVQTSLPFLSPGGKSDPASRDGLAVTAPQDSDLDLLFFPGGLSKQDTELREYMYQKLLESAQNDPQLIEASKGLPPLPPHLNEN